MFILELLIQPIISKQVSLVIFAQKSSKQHNKGCLNAKHVFWKVYKSDLEGPMLCDEICKQIAKFSVDIPVEMQSKSTRLSVTFSELEAKIFSEEEKLKIVCTLKLDILSTDMSMGEHAQKKRSFTNCCFFLCLNISTLFFLLFEYILYKNLKLDTHQQL